MNPVSCSLVTSMTINPWQYKDLLSIELVRSQCWFDSPRLACCKREKKTICLIPAVAPRPGRCDAALNNPSVTHHNLQDQSPKIEKDNEAGWDFERGRKHVAFSGATSFCHGQNVHFFPCTLFPAKLPLQRHEFFDPSQYAIDTEVIQNILPLYPDSGCWFFRIILTLVWRVWFPHSIMLVDRLNTLFQQRAWTSLEDKAPLRRC